MKNSPFQQRTPLIDGNSLIRIPQHEAYKELEKFAKNPNEQEREVGIVLPVGCGKSGCITLAPFAFSSARTLVIAPGLNIAKQLYNDFDPSISSMFYIKCRILDGQPYPEPVEIRGKTTNLADLEEADVVLTNIQQLQRQNNHWLQNLPHDFFDLILFDEGHHSVADSWHTLKTKFPNARIVNFSATPLRADGQLMAGRILYSFPIYRAIQEGYVKRLKAIVLNPKTLRYVRRADAQEIEVSLDEVRQLGEQDADFRRSIVTSSETLNTIVDASIRELDKLREGTGEKRLKIIASALNYEHCRQIVEAYNARGRRADYVHSIEESNANKKVMDRLENHELDVIVQVRKLGEGFDHPYLSVAAVFSIFANLSPFVQFVGRIMRVIKQNAPSDVLNQGTVIFHAGANVARRWEDFQQYSEADREYFDALLPMEGLNFSSSDELQVEIQPQVFEDKYGCEVRSQSEIHIEEIPLITNDPEALKALQLLKAKGYSLEQVHEAYELIPIPVTRVRQRQAKRNSLDTWARTETGRILAEKSLNSHGRDLDRKHLGKTNFVVIKSTIDRHINELVGHKAGERHEFNKQELEKIEQNFSAILDAVTKEIFDAED
ncbi:TPA: DEAD/DEAH box helicase [Legionella pneumophila]|uniref:UvrABC system protein B n=1 Tax=Legionella jamestowniensis TaxID=455 RepID=A0A0W0UKW8_9GAMM|nr:MULTISPECIES: DEAD/DEAH box helicase family protein [Legionella]HAT8850026.1 DEAD/DEAH box helicase [Legionella pneumophila subsp. pneumophila]KTD08396.1 UvrABC system protein B [Legionella jamestowniensis]CZI71266.1 Predicted HKD family nuclease [Legionella pneumophila]CZI71512.1 Predicted HKD family nuclease [Legionella pneumophila]CZP34864.1 Predicted HKD family nuclease [Legionella pneumophila]